MRARSLPDSARSAAAIKSANCARLRAPARGMMSSPRDSAQAAASCATSHALFPGYRFERGDQSQILLKVFTLETWHVRDAHHCS